MVNQTFVQRLEKYQQFRKENYLCNKDQHKALVENPPKTDALILTCSDPRVVPSLTFLTEPGDEFVDQSIGNVFTENTAIALRTGILVRDVNLVLIMGHSDCLAMKCCLNLEDVNPHIGIDNWLKTNAFLATCVADDFVGKRRQSKRALEIVTKVNIVDQTNRARRCLAQLSEQTGRPELLANTVIAGLYYDLATAQLFVLDEGSPETGIWKSANRFLKQLRK